MLAIGLVWAGAGGLQNPLFLVLFALPVLAGGLLSRIHAYLTATGSLVLVATVSLAQAPELRWYVAVHHPVGAWLASLPDGGGGGPALFAGFYAPVRFFMMTLELFGVGMTACALAADALGVVVRGFSGQLAAAREVAARTERVWLEVLAETSCPTALVDADTFKTICHSRSLVDTLCDPDAPPPRGADLFSLLHFSQPETVRALIAAEGGDAPFHLIRARGGLRAVAVRVRKLAQSDHRVALMMIEDITQSFCAETALDNSDYAAIIFDANGRVLSCNRQARSLLSRLEPGAEAASLLPNPAVRPRWWEPRLGGRRKASIQIDARTYQISSSSVTIPGEAAPWNVVTIAPHAGPAAIERTDIHTVSRHGVGA